MAAITHRLRCEILEARRQMAVDLTGSMSIAVDSTDLDGLRAAEIQLQYDPNLLSLAESDIRPGKLWQGQASLLSHIDYQAGTVNIFLFSAQPIAGDLGNLIDLNFDIGDTVAADVSSARVSQLRFNEGAIAAEAQIKVGDLTLNRVQAETLDASSELLTLSETSQLAPSSPGNACAAWSETPLSESANETSLENSIETRNEAVLPGSQPFVHPESEESPLAVNEPTNSTHDSAQAWVAPLIKLRSAWSTEEGPIDSNR